MYETWKTDEGAKPASIHRTYPTKLSIQPGELGGHKVLLLEIESDRGALPEMGEKTTLKVALMEAKRVSETTVLYRLVALGGNPNEALAFSDSAQPCAASCTSSAGVTVFVINYSVKFTDVYRFQGRELDKAGSIWDEKQGMVHWTEHLVRQGE